MTVRDALGPPYWLPCRHEPRHLVDLQWSAVPWALLAFWGAWCLSAWLKRRRCRKP